MMMMVHIGRIIRVIIRLPRLNRPDYIDYCGNCDTNMSANNAKG